MELGIRDQANNKCLRVQGSKFSLLLGSSRLSHLISLKMKTWTLRNVAQLLYLQFLFLNVIFCIRKKCFRLKVRSCLESMTKNPVTIRFIFDFNRFSARKEHNMCLIYDT